MGARAKNKIMPASLTPQGTVGESDLSRGFWKILGTITQLRWFLAGEADEERDPEESPPVFCYCPISNQFFSLKRKAYLFI